MNSHQVEKEVKILPFHSRGTWEERRETGEKQSVRLTCALAFYSNQNPRAVGETQRNTGRVTSIHTWGWLHQYKCCRKRPELGSPSLPWPFGSGSGTQRSSHAMTGKAGWPRHRGATVQTGVKQRPWMRTEVRLSHSGRPRRSNWGKNTKAQGQQSPASKANQHKEPQDQPRPDPTPAEASEAQRTAQGSTSNHSEGSETSLPPPLPMHRTSRGRLEEEAKLIWIVNFQPSPQLYLSTRLKYGGRSPPRHLRPGQCRILTKPL